ncbi:unnamed protein product [Phytomonas sp. EM1]|nr:unnamed protein product [Phytomonas sp. EM1]|eukprot:CCW61239.1 unnamed protein product [Phytomonas sp. isolate EM1]
MQRTLFFYSKKKDNPCGAPDTQRISSKNSLNAVPVDVDKVESNNTIPFTIAADKGSISTSVNGNGVQKRPRSPSLSSSVRSRSSDKRSYLDKNANTESGEPPKGAASSSRWLADLILDVHWRRFLSPIMEDSWRDQLFYRIELFLDRERAAGKLILPPAECIFSAFNSTPLGSLKVVLLGQDPYHNIGQAHGMCFSVLPGVHPPPSLQNIYKELANDIPGFKIPSHGYLEGWARQGMLMLNATLTVEAHKANAHSHCGWQLFTNDVIQLLSRRCPNRLVFLLWGNFARAKKGLIDLSRHVIIECAHPSPLSSRHWFGCRCFSKCNAALEGLGHTPMSWQLPMHLTQIGVSTA